MSSVWEICASYSQKKKIYAILTSLLTTLEVHSYRPVYIIPLISPFFFICQIRMRNEQSHANVNFNDVSFSCHFIHKRKKLPDR